MLAEYTPLVRKIAGGFMRKLPRNVLREDLIAAGMSGLWDAIRRHHSSGDDNFEWYVRIRVRGAILDELRAQDWLPRRARAKASAAIENSPDAIVASIVRDGDLSELEQRSMISPVDGADVLLDAYRFRQKLDEVINRLPGRERFVLVEHYFNGILFKDLADELGISEPRISQIHTRAISRLRQLAREDDDHGLVVTDPPKPTRRRRLRVPSQPPSLG